MESLEWLVVSIGVLVA